MKVGRAAGRPRNGHARCLRFGALAGFCRRGGETTKVFFLAGLAEVHLKERSGIVGGTGPSIFLRLVEVSESDVARRGRQSLGEAAQSARCDAALRFAEECPSVRVRHGMLTASSGRLAEVLDGPLAHPCILAPASRLLAARFERRDHRRTGMRTEAARRPPSRHNGFSTYRVPPRERGGAAEDLDCASSVLANVASMTERIVVGFRRRRDLRTAPPHADPEPVHHCSARRRLRLSRRPRVGDEVDGLLLR